MNNEPKAEIVCNRPPEPAKDEPGHALTIKILSPGVLTLGVTELMPETCGKCIDLTGGSIHPNCSECKFVIRCIELGTFEKIPIAESGNAHCMHFLRAKKPLVGGLRAQVDAARIRSDIAMEAMERDNEEWDNTHPDYAPSSWDDDLRYKTGHRDGYADGLMAMLRRFGMQHPKDSFAFKEEMGAYDNISC